MSSNDNERVLHSKSDNTEIMINDKADEVLGELFQSLLSRYGLETSMKRNHFIFDSFHLLCYQFQKTYFQRGESYTDSLDLIKNKKAIINSINKKDNKCLQYSVTVALNHKEIKKTRK